MLHLDVLAAQRAEQNGQMQRDHYYLSIAPMMPFYLPDAIAQKAVEKTIALELSFLKN